MRPFEQLPDERVHELLELSLTRLNRVSLPDFEQAIVMDIGNLVVEQLMRFNEL